jgi:hypothetical protein
LLERVGSRVIGLVGRFSRDWELSLGIYCTVKGFRPESPILQADAREHRRDAMPAATPA